MSAERQSAEPDGAIELVLAIAHELGNLAAALRIQSHLLDDSLAPRQLAGAAVVIDELAAQQGGWLALLRPLLAPKSEGGDASPESCILGVADALRELGQRAVRVETSAAPDLPRVGAPPQLLHQLVLLLANMGAESARPSGLVRLSAAAKGEGVVINVVDDGPEDRELATWRSGEHRGRVLCCIVVEHLARPLGGELHVGREDERTCVSLWLPPLVR